MLTNACSTDRTPVRVGPGPQQPVPDVRSGPVRGPLTDPEPPEDDI